MPETRTFSLVRCLSNSTEIALFDVTVEQDGDEYVATVPELNMSMSGTSEGDAYNALFDYVYETVSFLQRLHPSKLGPEPARQLAIIEAAFRPVATGGQP